MKTIKLNGKAVTLYDGIEELPMPRFHRYNKYLLLDAGIGSDLAAFDRHTERILAYLRQKDEKNAMVELDNMRQNVYFILQNVAPTQLSFAALVISINGEPCNDLSDEGLRKTFEKINGMTVQEFQENFESFKKKIESELRAYFPQLFEDAETKEFYDILKNRTLLQLREITDGKTDEDKLSKLTDRITTYTKPRLFSGSKNSEIEYDKCFENLCLAISQNLHTNPKRMTVLEFYNAYEYVKSIAESNKKLK